MFDKQQKQKKEQAEAAYENTILDKGRRIQPPGVWRQAMCHTTAYNDETVIPHADIEQNGEGKYEGDLPANFFKQKK